MVRGRGREKKRTKAEFVWGKDGRGRSPDLGDEREGWGYSDLIGWVYIRADLMVR